MRKVTKEIARKAEWLDGTGPYACVSFCQGGSTISRFPTQEEAEAAKAFIDNTGCGSRCSGWHEVMIIPGKRGSHHRQMWRSIRAIRQARAASKGG